MLRSMLALALVAPTALAQVFLPAGSNRDTIELNARSNYPLMRTESRAQFLLAASEIGTGARNFTRLELRYDGPSLGAAGGVIGSFEILLANTNVTPAQSSGQFAANLSVPPTRVVSVQNHVFGADASPNPSPWGGPGGALSFLFQAPFAYQGGTLAIELLGAGNGNGGNQPQNCQLDAELDPQAGVVDGSATANGTGCGGAVLGVAGQLAPGGQIAAFGSGFGPGQLAIQTLGTSRTLWGGIPLPIPLDGLGAPGCAILNDWLLDLRTLALPGGSIEPYTPAWTWVVPADAAFNGATVQLQALAVKSGANQLGLVTSNNVQVRLGTWRPLFRGYVAHFHHEFCDAAVASHSAPLTLAMRLH